MLASIYEKVELKNYFDVFREKLINYKIKYLKNAEDVLMLIQDLVDTKAYFDAKNEPNIKAVYREGINNCLHHE